MTKRSKNRLKKRRKRDRKRAPEKVIEKLTGKPVTYSVEVTDTTHYFAEITAPNMTEVMKKLKDIIKQYDFDAWEVEESKIKEVRIGKLSDTFNLQKHEFARPN